MPDPSIPPSVLPQSIFSTAARVAASAAGLAPEEIAQWAEADRRHVWHPFTHMQGWMEREPLIVARGDGVKLQDLHGRWFYDGTASIWLNVHGHCVEPLNHAIREQLELIAHSTLLGQSNIPAIALSQRLSELTGHRLPRVFLSDNGACAVEAALKIAIQFFANEARGQNTSPGVDRTRKTKILRFANNYHGDTAGPLAVAADELFHWPFLDSLPEHPQAEFPYPYRRHSDGPKDGNDGPIGVSDARETEICIDHAQRIFAARHAEIAAVIVEPVQGAGGILPAPPAFFRALRELCDEYHALLIFDEVATGFGRAGRMFAFEDLGVCPDVLCLGKGITGGYLPLAATLVSDTVFRSFLGPVDSGRTFFHGHSYTGNQLACAVAVANLDLLQRDVIPTLPGKIAAIQRATESWREEMPHVGEIRQAGMMLGIELVADRQTKRTFPYRHQPGYIVADFARDRGLLIRPIGRNVIFMPPLASPMADLEIMLAILGEALRDAMPRLGAIATTPD